MSYWRNFMSTAMYIKCTFRVHSYGHEKSIGGRNEKTAALTGCGRGSALADLVARSRVVDLRITLFVSDRVVEADDAQVLVEPFDCDLVVGAADVGVGAGALDGQLVVVSADIDGFPVRAI